MSEEQITMNKPEKTPARIAAGKRLSEYNKTMRDRQQSGKTPNVKDTEPIHGENNSEDVNNNGGMNLTRIIIFAGLSCLAYYMYTSTNVTIGMKKLRKMTLNNKNSLMHQVIIMLISYAVLTTKIHYIIKREVWLIKKM